jgi:autotransporter-associated beta strand protein
LGDPNSATQNVWTGKTSTDWTVGSNWSTGVPPTTGSETRLDTTDPNETALGVNGAATGATGTLVIGGASGGSGTLTLQNGSALVSTELFVGENGGAGSVLVDSGAMLTTSGDVYLGRGRVIAPGSSARSDHAEDSVAPASVVVRNGAQWSVAGSLYVGRLSTGMLDLYDAATVTAAIVAVGAGARGELSVVRGATLQTSKLGKGAHPALVIFDQGTLRATAGADEGHFIGGFPAGQLDIRGGGMTIDDGGLAVSAECPLSGPGALTKTGGGTLALLAHNTYGAGTTIEAGTLQVAKGIMGDVTVQTGATLAFVCERDFVFGGVINGGGRLEQNGGDNLTLVRDNTYTGGTTVSAGTLVIGDRGATGSIVGDVTVEARCSLLFYRGDLYTFAGTITGEGTVQKDADGTVVLTAAHGYTGATMVEAGTLLVDGSIASSTSVNAGGTLGGRGTIDNDVAVTGTIAPGSGSGSAGIGTLTINGKFTSQGGTLAIDAMLGNDGSPSDLLRIGGDAIMGSGPTRVTVTNLGDTAAETTGEGIKIVDVGGASAANLFVLDAPVNAGDRTYGLFQGGVANPRDGHWYLRSVATGSV